MDHFHKRLFVLTLDSVLLESIGDDDGVPMRMRWLQP